MADNLSKQIRRDTLSGLKCRGLSGCKLYKILMSGDILEVYIFKKLKKTSKRPELITNHPACKELTRPNVPNG